jgi:AraC family transcriptional regulator
MRSPTHRPISKKATLDAWRLRMQRVTDWLVEHLDQPFDLDRLAQLAYFSPYHFHRVYTVVMGEPIAETIRRMRLHRAAVQLVTSQQPVLHIARQANYGSVQAFGRVFRQTYGLAPAQYRLHAKASLALVQQGMLATSKRQILNKPFPVGLGDSPESAVQIVQLKPVRVAALPHRGSYNTIGNSFQKLTAWAVGHNVMNSGTRMFGIFYDDPESKPLDDLRSDACIGIPKDFDLGARNSPIYLGQTSSGRCARMIFTGPYAELHTAYTWLYKVWLPQSGEEPGEQPPLEEYLNDPRSNLPASLKTAISIPLKA